MENTTLIRADDLQQVLLEKTTRRAIQRAVALIARSIPSSSVTVLDVDADQHVRFAAAQGIPWTVLRRVERSFNVQLPANLAGIMHTRQTCFIQDVPAYEDWRGSREGLVSYVGFPVIVDRKVASIINVQTSSRRLSEQDVQGLLPLISLMGLVIARYLREQQAARRENFLALLHEVTVDGISAVSPDQYMDAVVRSISRRLGYRHVAIFLLDDQGEALVLCAQKGYTTGGQRVSVPLANRSRIIVRAFQRRRVVRSSDPRGAALYRPHMERGRSELALPLLVGGKAIGVLGLESSHADRFTREDIRNLTPLAAGVGLMLANMQINQLLRRQALQDALTGAHNRHAMEGIVAEELARARRHERDLSFVMLDVDEFKFINDRLGHAEGDRVLETFVAVLRSSLRSVDKVIRYGGDEFLLVLPETSQKDTEAVLERVFGCIEQKVQTALGPVHCSAGVATLEGDGPQADLVALADKRMYEAKARHRARLEEGVDYQ
jgi:diguanylate cyclase (GGDEF)-like protein